MSNFFYWAVAHGVYHGSSKLMHHALYVRGAEIERLLKLWNEGIIWC